MPQTIEELEAVINELTEPGFRERLLDRGLARGIIWRDGVLPPGAPEFSPGLSSDLLTHGFRCLEASLRLRALGGSHTIVNRGLRSAAEALESATRYGARNDNERGFHLTMAAAAFHIGGYAARAFTLMASELETLNLASYERSLVHLMRRDFNALRVNSFQWLSDEANSDAGLVARLTENEDHGVDDAIAVAMTRCFHHAIGMYEAALLSGEEELAAGALTLIERGQSAAADACHVPLWWSFTVARHLFDDLWGHTLHQLLPVEGGPPNWPTLRTRFISLLSSRPVAEIDLWPSQLDAAERVIDTSDDLVVALPTSAGKTRIAELCILRALADGHRVVYVTPLRALSSQVELSLARTFRPLGYTVTSVYGASGVAVADLETLRTAGIVVATPEKLDFAIRQEPEIIDDVSLIVLDEGHMIGLSEREIRYEMLVQRLLRRDDAAERRLICLSAVFTEGDAFDDFTKWLRADAPGDALRSTWRPTRQRPGTLEWQTDTAILEMEVEGERPFVPRFVEQVPARRPRRTPFPRTDQELLVAGTSEFLRLGHSVLIYCPIKVSVETTAKAFLKAHEQGYFDSLDGEDGQAKLNDALRVGGEWLGSDHPAVKALRLGIAVHHGSLPRQFLGEIETLLKNRTLRVCISSPTLAQGLDLCFSVLLFRSLHRNRRPIPAKEFANVVGRVGRAFVDLDGLYVLPIFENTTAQRAYRRSQFQGLIRQARLRQLESGVKQLIDLIVHILQERLGVDSEALIEYVLNAGSPWTVEQKDDDDVLPGVLVAALNELDTAIVGLIDQLDLPTEELADYLDACLASSYWQRRLEHDGAELRRMQEQVIRGRATWLWTNTTASVRRGLFAAGVGYGAGRVIAEHADALGQLLTESEDAITAGDVDGAVEAITSLARIIFEIHPFLREEGDDEWENALAEWIRGTQLSDFASNDAIGFLQNDVVYRLVWGVEAARLHLQHRGDGEQETPGGNVALCLTYGVPNRSAALLMQAGMTSRRLACIVPQDAGMPFADMDELREWIYAILSGTETNLEWDGDADTAEWNRFLRRFEHHEHATWHAIHEMMPAIWSGPPPQAGQFVRVMRDLQATRATITSASLDTLGHAEVPDTIRSQHFFARVMADGKTLDASFFGP